MSFSDPILRSLKYYLEEFHTSEQAVNDESAYLQYFCQTVELAFLKGLKTNSRNRKYQREQQRRKFWQMTIRLDHKRNQLSQVAHHVSINKRLTSDEGKFRFAIRYWLKQKSLSKVLKLLMDTPKEDLLEWYENDEEDERSKELKWKEKSIITTEGLVEQLQSLFMICDTSLNFQLDLNNSFFLDQSWELPQTKTHLVVPCDELGLQVIFQEGFCVISKVKNDSTLDEAVRIGDVILEVDDVLTFPTSFGARNSPVRVWHKHNHSEPCTVVTSSARGLCGNNVFGPFRSAVKMYQNTMSLFHERWERELNEKQEEEKKKMKSKESLDEEDVII